MPRAPVSAILCDRDAQDTRLEELEETMNRPIRFYGMIASILLLAGQASASTLEIILQPSDLLRQGNAYLEIGETEKAKSILARALDSNLTSRQLANAHNSMCVALIREEAWQTAMSHCNAAIKIVPTNWRFHNNRGNVFFGLGQYDLAMENYEKGLRLAPKSITLATNIDMLEAHVQSRKINTSFTPGPT